MTLALRASSYRDCNREYCSRRNLERARLTSPSRLPTPWYLSLAMALGIGMIVVDYAPKARAEELGHHLHHESDYRLLKQPGTDSSCCSDQDCAPVKAELRQGQWFAFRQSKWIAVPDEKIIRERNPTVEGGHLCYLRGVVVCFLPPNTGG